MGNNQAGPFALLSVSDKSGLESIAQRLVAAGYTLLSTGGSAKYLRAQGFEVVDVSSVTGFPEIMDGRVKTLHPAVHGGLLAKRKDQAHMDALHEHGLANIEVLVVNLYPFERTVASGAEHEDVIENIDIGGPAMLRAAAKNYENILVVVDPNDYERGDLLEGSLGLRRELAAKAFYHTSRYDEAIWTYLLGREEGALRYGENPHQRAWLVREPAAPALRGLKQLSGKELSYNNILDAEAALAAVLEFDEPTAVVVKHTNPCGVATEAEIDLAFEHALAGDPVSAFGGILALNRKVGASLAQKISQTFWEVVLAPGFSREALDELSKKKNLRLLVIPEGFLLPPMQSRTTAFGTLKQDADPRIKWEVEGLEIPTKLKPNRETLEAMGFLWRVVKHVKSNAIVVGVGNRTLGVGAGQMSRVDAVDAALRGVVSKADTIPSGPLVLASDAFFPFADGVEKAAGGGVRAIVQPGGSKRDAEVVEACDALGITMVFTGTRHFKH